MLEAKPRIGSFKDITELGKQLASYLVQITATQNKKKAILTLKKHFARAPKSDPD